VLQLFCFYCTYCWAVHSLLLVLRLLVRYWWAKKKATIYPDDGIVAVQGFERALHEGMLVKGDLDWWSSGPYLLGSDF